MGLALAHQHNRGGHARGHRLAGRSCEEGPGAFHHTRLIVHRVLHVGAGGKRLSDALDTPSLRRARAVAPTGLRRLLGLRASSCRALALFPLLPTAPGDVPHGHTASADTIPSASMVRQNGTKSPRDRGRCQAPGRSAPRCARTGALLEPHATAAGSAAEARLAGALHLRHASAGGTDHLARCLIDVDSGPDSTSRGSTRARAPLSRGAGAPRARAVPKARCGGSPRNARPAAGSPGPGPGSNGGTAR